MTAADPTAIDLEVLRSVPLAARNQSWWLLSVEALIAAVEALRERVGVLKNEEKLRLLTGKLYNHEKARVEAAEAINKKLREKVATHKRINNIAVTEFTKLNKRVEAAEAINRDMRAALEALIDDDECRLDHSGFCQTHTNEMDDGQCAMVVARAVLSKATEATP